jgi:hypothetical protein
MSEISTPLSKRDHAGKLLPGSTPVGAAPIQPGEVTATEGRLWGDPKARAVLQERAPKVIQRACQLIDDDKAPASDRVKAMELILAFGFGRPQVATIVKYEIDLIIKEYGLPPRHQLVDRYGNHLFKTRGQYKPSGDWRYALQRQQFIERMERQERGGQEPTVTTYEVPLRPKTEMLKRLTAEQARVDKMKTEIQAADAELREMREIYKEAETNLLQLRQRYMDMAPDPSPDSPQPETRSEQSPSDVDNTDNSSSSSQ